MGTDFGFGQRLAAKRQAKGLTQADLGVGLGTDGENASKSVVWGWEKNQHYPRVDQLRLICDRLGCSADYLVNGIAQELPFSRELMERVSQMDAGATLQLENVMRAHLGLSPKVDGAQPRQEETGALKESSIGTLAGKHIQEAKKSPRSR